MTLEDVKKVADAVIRPVVGDTNVEEIVVREDDDGPGEASVLVDAFLAPGTIPLDATTYLEIRRALTRELGAGGERRYAYLRLRDKAGDAEEGRPDMIPDA